ncbi:Na+/H+ antiporter NhaC family protein [Isoptericola variabilis]|uniref:Na+/H+ antiporter NhaC-like protein n=1 Tax=Isoptericola variabilis (strain 225) TaxID=743718 RepID=F6FSA0_ISOV2|nr:Na+/H+ antiporter NhaC family protein [Isoptericola variabilis]AEG43041.1 Na+/H+ antiporter NhaC-like protein [Isoptericola variabilis 225]TWH29991.1 Na+/H+ antiporter NhaC [Isoptericola variabilis J7]
MLESYPILTLVPPVLAIALVVITRKVLLSLGSGVLAAALLVAGFDPLETLRLVWDAFAGIFWDAGAVNTWYVFILVFTLLLGVIAAFIMMSGGTQAFADWAVRRIRTRRGAQLLPAILGIVIFIDDYFNALAVGQVSRPVTDRHRVSRAKLAYVIDSTSAPVAVLAPFSSWGAYIMGLLAPIVAASALTLSSVQAFLGAAASNYYAIAAVVMVWLVVVFQLDVRPMRGEEVRAVAHGRPYDEDTELPGRLSEDLPVHQPGAMRALVVPFALLVLGVFAGIVWSGYDAAGRWDAVEILAETDTSLALIWGGVLGLAGALFYYFRHTAANPRFAAGTFGRGWVEGVRSMLPAVSILLLAWMLGGLIEQLGTGEYLGWLVESADIDPSWLVPLIFVIAAAMAFATGTSWGSFALLLPLAGGIINTIDAPELLLPTFGAVLAGAVAGDHASPISDTTILSATGASCNVITHVLTQLPYAGGAALAALAGYVAVALGAGTLLGLLVTLGVLALLVVVAKTANRTAEDEAEQVTAGEAA